MRVNKYLAGSLALLMFASIACGMSDNLINQAVGGDENMQTVSSLWSDVPPMDGLTLSELESMPPFVKLAMRLVLGNLGRLNPEGQDQSTGTIDWIVFTTAKTPLDVQNFYTNDLMTANGWEPTGDNPCVSGSDQGAPDLGVVCVFQKTAEGKYVQLAILTALDEQTKQTNVFYLRLESAATPEPAVTP